MRGSGTQLDNQLLTVDFAVGPERSLDGAVESASRCIRQEAEKAGSLLGHPFQGMCQAGPDARSAGVLEIRLDLASVTRELPRG